METFVKNEYRTNSCGELTESDIGRNVTLSGWVASMRDHGGISFIDLRDSYGKTQILIRNNEELRDINRETVIKVSGKVVSRNAENFNNNIGTGKIEVEAEKIEVLGKSCNVLPFEIMDSLSVGDELRLKYRYLDLRNQKVWSKIKLRNDIIWEIRNIMRELNFEEIQTPILTASSPEGARDYLVPSRLYKGKFYALPQAPQQFKQLLMVSGIDRYFQIAPCFRDEDSRADRSPGEFYQFDVEMSFATQEDVFAIMENVLSRIFAKFSNFKVDSAPYIRIPYREALEKYGTDKPDLRNPLLIENITEIFANTSFNSFAGKTIKCVSATVGEKPRSFYDNLTNFMIENGAKGLAWLKVDGSELIGPIAKFMSEEEKKQLINKTNTKTGDAIFVIADENMVATKLTGILRTELGKRLDLIEKDMFRFCWIVDFPMFEFNEETGKIDFSHNPFSMPQGEMDALNTKDPLDILAYQYDIVVNGIELSSGAVRNHNTDVMVKAFEIAGYDEETVKTKFSALYNAFQYGAPPHAGIAPGLDRMVMLLSGDDSIKEVIAFPLNQKAMDVMMNAPCEVTEAQLRDIHIKIRD